MRSVLLTVILAAAVFSFTARAQGRPDFSGTWTRVADKNDPPARGVSSHTIKQTATEIAVTIAGRSGPETSIYRLDGSTSTNRSQSPEGPLTITGTARWDGSSLVIETTREIRGTTITTREVRMLDATGGEMTIEATTRSPQGEVKRTVVLTRLTQ
jgi:hypothetical protein